MGRASLGPPAPGGAVCLSGRNPPSPPGVSGTYPMQMSPRPCLQPWASRLCRGWSQSSAHDRPLPTSVLSVCFPPDYRHLNGPGVRQAIWPSAQAPLGKTQLPAPAYPLLGPNPRCLLPTSHAKSGPTLAGLGAGGLPLLAAGVSNTEAPPHSTRLWGAGGPVLSAATTSGHPRRGRRQVFAPGGESSAAWPGKARAGLRAPQQAAPSRGPAHTGAQPRRSGTSVSCTWGGAAHTPHPPVWGVHCLSPGALGQRRAQRLVQLHGPLCL